MLRFLAPPFQLLPFLCCLLPAFAAHGAEEEGKPKSPPFREHETRTIEGWVVQVDRRLLEGEQAQLGATALRVLGDQLYHIALRLPEERVKELREMPIWLDLDHPLRAMQYHPSAGWLRDHGYDPAMAKAVHIPDARRMIDHVRRYDQPSAVMHELAHAYHDRVLGFDHGEIRRAFERVRDSKQLEEVLHMSGRRQRHYALTNEKEFFAEMTESFLGTNDFYPFVRGELQESDPETFALLKKIWLDSPK